ncbi:Rap1a/Tai family immunity protein [Sinorhizobium meliloti]|uniref:Rap1a/Tai family immunity protein n=1 Tax=Rhizobium meliloti TaxID=382 RepID=UPI00398C8438
MKVANLAMVLMTAASDAQASNGNEINRWCENDPAIALAYVDGIMDAYATVGPPIDYCPARDVTYRQVRDVVCKWVNSNAEERHRSGALLVPLALSKVWPCED